MANLFPPSRTEWRRFSFDVPPYFEQKSYDFRYPVYKKWDTSKYRVLVLLDTPDGDSKRSGTLLEDDAVLTQVISGVFSYAYKQVKHPTLNMRKTAFALNTFTYFNDYDLPNKWYNSVNKSNTNRMHALIDKIKPTHIIAMGSRVSSALFPKDDLLAVKRGWLRKLTLPTGDKVKVITTLDVAGTYFTEAEVKKDESALDTAIENANILGYISRNVATLFNKGLVYKTKSKLKPNYVVIKTAEEFKYLLARANKEPYVGLDLETTGLETYGTKVLMAQIGFSAKVTYILILDHKDSPLVDEDKKKCRKYLTRFLFPKRKNPNKLPILMGQNLGYDLRILREYCKIPFVPHDIYDTIAGEYLLDENKKILRNHKAKPYTLNEILARYGDTYYYTAEFGKENRTTISTVDIDPTSSTDPCLCYASADVQCLFTIKSLQLIQAENLTWTSRRQSYLPIYLKAVTKTYSAHVQVMSHVEAKGVYLNRKYYGDMIKDDSVISEAISEKLEVFKDKKNKTLAKANTAVLKSQGAPVGSIFAPKWVFDINKQAHKHTLFFDTLKLEPINYSKKTGIPSLGKPFKSAYKDTIPLVEELIDLDQLQKLKSSFILPFYEKSGVGDGAIDGHLHSGYGYHYVVTGRSNSFSPSLQQTPTHGKSAKLVKAGMVSPPKHILMAGDYASHEVRCWGLLSQDETIAELYARIQRILSAYRLDPSAENLRRLVEETDIHKIFYEMNTGVPVLEVTDEQRLASKAITFGKIYGKSDASTARDLNMALDIIVDITIKFFKRFNQAKRYLDHAGKFSSKNYYITQPLGFRRNLYGYLSTVHAVVGAMVRRSANSPIQGFASQLGYMGNWEYIKDQHTVFEKFKLEQDKVRGSNALVHDSNYNDVLYANLFPSMHLMEYHMVAGIKHYVKDNYDFAFNVDLGWDFEIGASWATTKSYKGEFDPKYVKPLVEEAIDYQNSSLVKYDKRYKSNFKSIWRSMMKTRDATQPWLDKKRPQAWRDYL